MDVFVSDVPLDNLKTLPSADELENSLKFLFNIDASKNLASISRSPYNMVLAYVCAMF